MNAKWDIRFLRLANEVASWSKDPSTKTGAVIANGKQIISVGFNGFPQGMDDSEERYANREEKYSRVVHCEINALLFARGNPLLTPVLGNHLVPGATLYTVPFLSCDRCVVQMLQAGVGRFVAQEETREQRQRWGTAFRRTKSYITECGGSWQTYSKYEIESGHIRERHIDCDTVPCNVCELFICKVCGGLEGGLLPKCPGRWLTIEEHDVNYAHYCSGTGPFAGEKHGWGV